jgi:hypothetical protein
LQPSWVLAGGIHYLIQFGGATPDYKVFRGEPGGLRHPFEIIHEAIHLDARGIIQLGLLLLIATPVARVAFFSHRLCFGEGLDVRGHHADRACASHL